MPDKRKGSPKPSRVLLAGTRRKGARRVEEALSILSSVGIPIESLSKVGQDRIALALLAIADMRPETPWNEAAVFEGKHSWKLTSRQIITFQNTHWGQNISSGSYDDIRRVDLEPLLLAGIAIASAGNPDANQNNPTRSYAIHPQAAELLHSCGTANAAETAEAFIARAGSLEERIARRRPPKLHTALPDGKLIELASGEHNQLQKAVLEQFLPHFVADPKVLYIGDASNKYLHRDSEALASLGIPDISDEMMPDLIVLDQMNRWVLLIEAVHSSNPISKLRHLALEEFTANCQLPKVYVSVFANRAEFRKWVLDISWETEVWLADSPSHLIHFNGDKYLGPHPLNAGNQSPRTK